MPKHVVVESCSEVVGGCEGTTSDDPPAHDAEHALNLVQPRRVFGREVSLPTGMFVEPFEYVVGVVSRKVVHDEVAQSVWVTGIHQVEQFDECRRIVVVGGETEELSASNVERAHQAQGSVTYPRELAYGCYSLWRSSEMAPSRKDNQLQDPHDSVGPPSVSHSGDKPRPIESMVVSRREDLIAFRHPPGSKQRIEVLIGIYTSRLLAFAKSQGASSEDAKDIVQETMIDAWRYVKSVGYESAFLYATVLNKLRVHRRKQRLPERITSEPVCAANPEAAFELAELACVLAEELAQFDPIERTIFLLRFLENLTIEETMERLQVTKGKVVRATEKILTRIKPRLTSRKELICRIPR